MAVEGENYAEIIEGELYIGDKAIAKDLEAILSLGFRGIVNCTPSKAEVFRDILTSNVSLSLRFLRARYVDLRVPWLRVSETEKLPEKCHRSDQLFRVVAIILLIMSRR